MKEEDLLLRKSCCGSVTTEFALLAPLMFALLLGVIQIGIGMHSYNALRGISSDLARYVTVEYQTSNQLTNAQIQAVGTAIAVQAPYMLDSDNILVNISDADTQRVAGAKELTLQLEYSVPSLMDVIGVSSPRIRYTKSIFLLVEEAGSEDT